MIDDSTISDGQAVLRHLDEMTSALVVEPLGVGAQEPPIPPPVEPPPAPQAALTSARDPKTPPPLPGTPAAQRAVGTPAIPALHRIAGTVDQSPPCRLESNGKTYSVSDIAAATRSHNARAKIAAVNVLGALESLNSSELHLAASTLFAIGHEEGEIAEASRISLATLAQSHCDRAEGLNIALQVLRRSASNGRFAPLAKVLEPAAREGLLTLVSNPEPTRRQFSEQRQVALRAFEVPALRVNAITSLTALLENRTEELKNDRKSLASNVLAAMRATSIGIAGVKELKHLAGIVFATGVAPTSNSGTHANDLDDSTVIFVTSAQAEVRRQYGLAMALEVKKAIVMRGRPMELMEYATAFRFGTPEPGIGANKWWFNRLEWNTAVRLLVLASREDHLPMNDVASLMYLLATRIKVEDPNDTRDSARRPDLIPGEEREKLMREAGNLLVRSGLDRNLAERGAIAFAETLLGAEFSGFTFNPPKRESPSDGSGINRSAKQAKLLAGVLRSAEPNFVARLLPEEVDLLRQLQGLSLDEFKTLTLRLRGRAVTCEWARMAILDLVRAPHHPSVGESARTAVLGGLVNDARRVNKLSQQLEKDVFAVSAEIPALSFLSREEAEESEDS